MNICLSEGGLAETVVARWLIVFSKKSLYHIHCFAILQEVDSQTQKSLLSFVFFSMFGVGEVPTIYQPSCSLTEYHKCWYILKK